MKSNNAKKGVERAPHRSLFYAAGYTDEELEQPLMHLMLRLKVEMVNSYSLLRKIKV